MPTEPRRPIEASHNFGQNFLYQKGGKNLKRSRQHTT
jgi:hypothetical protein